MRNERCRAIDDELEVHLLALYRASYPVLFLGWPPEAARALADVARWMGTAAEMHENWKLFERHPHGGQDVPSEERGGLFLLSLVSHAEEEEKGRAAAGETPLPSAAALDDLVTRVTEANDIDGDRLLGWTLGWSAHRRTDEVISEWRSDEPEGELMDESEIARDAERERRSESGADSREEFAGGGEPPLHPAVIPAGSTPRDVVEIERRPRRVGAAGTANLQGGGRGMSGSKAEVTAGPTTDYRYAPEPLVAASATIERITAILALRWRGGDDGDGSDGARRVRRSNLSPAYRDALHGELRVLRAQLYSSGLFAEITNVDLLANAKG
jgi:hypothetical protein